MRTSTNILFFPVATALLLAACDETDKDATSGTTEITAAAIESKPNDQELIRRVEGAISARPELSIAARNTEVDAVDGVIVLQGSAPDPFVKNDIERLAASVPGVITTLNKLDVRQPTMAEVDDRIAFSIQRALVTDPSIANDAENVTIDVNDGIVTLRGRASSADAKLAVERVVERTPGVVTVMSSLSLP